MSEDGWRTALPTPARTRSGHGIHIVAGLVTTDAGMRTAVRVGEDGRTAVMSDIEDLRLVGRLRYLIGERLRGDAT